MAFHSIAYLFFLPSVLVAYWLMRERRAQNVLLLLGSYFFYGFIHPWFLIPLFASTTVDYLCGRAMREIPGRKKLFLLASLASNLGLLAFFKYFGFFADNVSQLFHVLGLPGFKSTLDIVLPAGISFYTFQSLSYTFDVYRDKLEPRRNLLDFALYVSFFPQLFAGPIERPGTLLPRVEQPRTLSYEKVRSALLLLSWGFFKKLVIADSVAVIANKVFVLEEVGFVLLWVGVLAFCIQIYADFSAYTDIARGTARLLGFELMQNFNHPYISQNPAEFWRRWHISLSTWIRDYLYIPLGGSHGSERRNAYILLVTFGLSGFWHGASWNFVIWGLYHGFLLLAYRWIGKRWPELLSAKMLTVPRVLVFFALTNLGWLLFREQNIERLFALLSLNPLDNPPLQVAAAAYFIALIALYAAPLAIHAFVDQARFNRLRFYGVWQSVAATLCFLGTLILRSPGKSDFIYFQF